MRKFIIVFFSIFFGSAVAENTYWYSEGLVTDALTCTSGGDITTPAGPYKYGYRFVEWQPAQTYDMSVLDATENSTSYTSANDQWRVAFSYGTVIGVSLCQSVTQAQFEAGAVLNPGSPGGTNCYCRAVAFIPNGATNVYAASPSVWGFARTGYYGYASGNDNCKNKCLPNCASYVASTDTLRASLYGTIINQ